MEERSNKTIMCSVFFLDIVEYSKKSVSGQISLKDRFNSYLSKAISEVPLSDRIILDTGDGAAINFLGDVEDALKAALSLRESLLSEDAATEPPLLVRMGINLGPVRLVRDINGQPNIVGDGINVAQRVMGFADASQILVSRSYYDAVSRLSPQYAGMFHYQGSRTDKHVREHEVYAIGYPGDKSTTVRAAATLPEKSPDAAWQTQLKTLWNNAAGKLNEMMVAGLAQYQRADTQAKAIYGASVILPFLIVGGVWLSAGESDSAPQPSGEMVQPVSAVVASTANTDVPNKPTEADKKSSVSPSEKLKPTVPVKNTNEKSPIPNENGKPKHAETGVTINGNGKVVSVKSKPAAVPEPSIPLGDAYIQVSCKEGALVFVDGVQKGKLGASGNLTVAIVPNKPHAVIVSHPAGGLQAQNVDVAAGKTMRVRPAFCN
ncbi:MAG: adenylate/guanylate cyclase domain-containing protein [Gallionella sp.]|nr:adenylate/guanylate cyclase domain-containing protein [Gallionella sp.]